MVLARASGTGHAEVNSLYINLRDETIALSTTRSTYADRCRRQGCMSNDVERAEENAKRQQAAADREAGELVRVAVVGIVLLIVFLAVLIAAKLRWSSTDFGRFEVPPAPRRVLCTGFTAEAVPSPQLTGPLVAGSRVTRWLDGRSGPVGTRLQPRA